MNLTGSFHQVFIELVSRKKEILSVEVLTRQYNVQQWGHIVGWWWKLRRIGTRGPPAGAGRAPDWCPSSDPQQLFPPETEAKACGPYCPSLFPLVTRKLRPLQQVIEVEGIILYCLHCESLHLKKKVPKVFLLSKLVILGWSEFLKISKNSRLKNNPAVVVHAWWWWWRRLYRLRYGDNSSNSSRITRSLQELFIVLSWQHDLPVPQPKCHTGW